jgi:hypothetical protein
VLAVFEPIDFFFVAEDFLFAVLGLLAGPGLY